MSLTLALHMALAVMDTAVAEADEFDVFLREVVLLAIFAVAMLALAYGLGNSWRRKVGATPSSSIGDDTPVDVSALSFHVSVGSLALSLTTIIALPISIIMVTQVRVVCHALTPAVVALVSRAGDNADVNCSAV
jgi:hypothetical protein